jgi:hypothetical protein
MTLTLRSPAFVGSLLLYPNYVQDYLDRVTAADVAAGNTSGLERGVTDAFNTALQTLVADTYLGISGNVITQAASTIKAMPWMMGARTLPGCLVPVVGTAPTNVNWVAGDYNRKTGLGDATNATKYLNTNRASNADPQNNFHQAVHVSTASTVTGVSAYMGQGAGTTGATHIAINTTLGDLVLRNRANTSVSITSQAAATGFIGTTRSVAGSFTYRVNSSNATGSVTSEAASAETHFVMARNNGGPTSYSTGRVRFYSIGESLDLAILQTRIDALTAALAAAIP